MAWRPRAGGADDKVKLDNVQLEVASAGGRGTVSSSFNRVFANGGVRGRGPGPTGSRRSIISAYSVASAVDALDRVLQRPHGGDRKSGKVNVDIVNVDRPTGNSESAALRRLRKDRPRP